MNERKIVTVDARTGEVRETRTRTEPGQSLQQRIDALEVGCEEHLPGGPPLQRVVAVSCDGCGQHTELLEPGLAWKLPDGWTSDHRGELCPQCQ